MLTDKQRELLLLVHQHGLLVVWQYLVPRPEAREGSDYEWAWADYCEVNRLWQKQPQHFWDGYQMLEFDHHFCPWLDEKQVENDEYHVTNEWTLTPLALKELGLD